MGESRRGEEGGVMTVFKGVVRFVIFFMREEKVIVLVTF